MNCCNDFGHCTQGSACPVRTTPATPPRTCDDLGTCQHRMPPCSGACEHPLLHAWAWGVQEAPAERPWDRFYLQIAMVAVYGASTGMAIGAGAWLWGRFGGDLHRLYLAASALWF